MAFEIRKFGIILAVAILFSIFVFALADAVIPEKDYPDYCQQANQNERSYYNPYPNSLNCSELPEPTQEQRDACPGYLTPKYAEGRCATEYTCDCADLADEYRNDEQNIRFWIAVILGAIAIAGGMLLPAKNDMNEWVGGGFILGGVITLFIATAMQWSEIHKIARPIVIALELILVLWIGYRRMMPTKKGKKK